MSGPGGIAEMADPGELQWCIAELEFTAKCHEKAAAQERDADRVASILDSARKCLAGAEALRRIAAGEVRDGDEC